MVPCLIRNAGLTFYGVVADETKQTGVLGINMSIASYLLPVPAFTASLLKHVFETEKSSAF
jgi:hypothetical protein